MAQGLFCIPCVTHRRWRRFTANKNIFHTQYDTRTCSVFQAEYDGMVFETFHFLFFSLLQKHMNILNVNVPKWLNWEIKVKKFNLWILVKLLNFLGKKIFEIATLIGALKGLLSTNCVNLNSVVLFRMSIDQEGKNVLLTKTKHKFY